MLARLMILFLVVPIVELTLLMMLADATNWKVSLALVLFTGVTGAWLVKHQGWRTMRRVQEELRAGHLPGDALFDGVLVLAAGLLLLTPGVLTDLTGILLLIPFTRAIAKRRLADWFRKHFKIQSIVTAATASATSARADVDDSQTFDAAARRLD